MVSNFLFQKLTVVSWRAIKCRILKSWDSGVVRQKVLFQFGENKKIQIDLKIFG